MTVAVFIAVFVVAYWLLCGGWRLVAIVALIGWLLHNG
jgi:hypothetical protein